MTEAIENRGSGDIVLPSVAPTSPDMTVCWQEELIHNPEVADLELPLRQLLIKLFPHVEGDEYSLLIGEGISATVPALAIKAAVDAIRIGGGQEPLPLLFLDLRSSFGSFASEESIAATIAAAKKITGGSSSDKKALVITDYIESGGHMDAVGVELLLEDIPYDIATVITSGRYGESGSCGTRLFFGERGGLPAIWMNRGISVVNREAWEKQEPLGDLTDFWATRDTYVLANRLVEYIQKRFNS